MKNPGIVGLWLITTLLTACATPNLPVPEVRQVSAAYEAAAAAGAPLLDELAIAERRADVKTAKLDAFRAQGMVVFLSFDPKLASSFASVGEPRRTAEQRRGLKVVGAYIDVLATLAEGRNVEEAKARIQTLAGNLGALAALAAGGPSLVAAPALAALGPVLDRAARAENAEELRRIALEGEQPIDELIGALIASAEDIYNVLIDESRRAATDTFSKNNDAAQKGEMLKISAYHVEVSNYVVLLEQLRATFRSLVAAVRAPSHVTLASLTASTNDLLLEAQAVRRAYAILRRPAAAGAP